MAKKILSVFIDESGDFGKFDAKSPNYYVAFVLHDQSIDISENIKNFDEHIERQGYPEHAIHTGPIIRREQVYKDEIMEKRKTLTMGRANLQKSLYLFSRLFFQTLSSERFS